MPILAYTLKNTPEPDKIKALYRNAFPREERLPWWLVRFLTIRPGTEVTAFYDGSVFCGFTLSASCKKTMCILFLAVEDGLRGSGYGSRILDHWKQQDPQRQILLNVELLDPQAENYAQRVQRMAFYKKNDFYDSGYDIDEVGGTFRVLSTVKDPDMDAYIAVFRNMSWGLWKPPVRKVLREQV